MYVSPKCICPKGLYLLPKGIVSFARGNCVFCPKELYHLPEGIVECPLQLLFDAIVLVSVIWDNLGLSSKHGKINLSDFFFRSHEMFKNLTLKLA